MRSTREAIGAAGLALIALVTMSGPFLAPESPSAQFADRAFAPPMRVHVRDASGFRAPFVYRQVLEDRIERRFREDRTAAFPLTWFSSGRFVGVDSAAGPLLLLGADALGRDVLSRMLHGARLSLGVTVIGALFALVIGTLIGGLAGAVAGRTDSALMLVADFVLVLPGVYLVLVLRALLPQILSTPQVFWLMAGLFGVAGWPHVARGVRAIVATERACDYAEAARAAGAGPWRLARHLVPAARGFLAVEFALLVPALLVAEATISFLGLGFPEPLPSWGTMLHEAGNVNGLSAAPWTLGPALALFLVVLCVQLVSDARAPRSFMRYVGRV